MNDKKNMKKQLIKAYRIIKNDQGYFLRFYQLNYYRSDLIIKWESDNLSTNIIRNRYLGVTLDNNIIKEIEDKGYIDYDCLNSKVELYAMARDLYLNQELADEMEADMYNGLSMFQIYQKYMNQLFEDIKKYKKIQFKEKIKGITKKCLIKK